MEIVQIRRVEVVLPDKVEVGIRGVQHSLVCVRHIRESSIALKVLLNVLLDLLVHLTHEIILNYSAGLERVPVRDYSS